METTPPPPWSTPPGVTPPPPPAWGQTGFDAPPPPPRTTPLAGFAESGEVKRPRPVMLIIGIVLMLVAVSAVIVGIVLLVNASGVADDNAVAEGRIGGPAVSYEQPGDGQITVYLRSSSSGGDVVTSEASGTTCFVEHSGGRAQIRGNSQSLSVTLGSTATIGSVDVDSGPVTVQCDGSRSSGERFTVARGGPPSVIPGFVFVFGGGALFVAGLVLTIVGAVIRAKRRRPPPRPTPYVPG